jgi:predicted flap endonuclease-1-like 5' DNA nuclease
MTGRERLSSDNELRSGGWDDDTAWNERATFRIAVESREVSEGRLVWRTRAYHEEHDQRRVWTGVPDEALIEWIHEQLRHSIGNAVPALVRRLPESAASAAPASAAPLDDLQQIPGIGPAIARRLHAAGITTFAALAACSLSDLAAWTGRSTEQITRMGWVERARELAHPAPPAAPAPEQKPAADTPAAEEAPSLLAATTAEPHVAEPLPVDAVEAAPPTAPEAPLVEAAEVEPMAVAAAPSVAATVIETQIEAEAQSIEERTVAEIAESLIEAAEEIREAQEMMLEESPIVFAAILLNEEGDVQDVHLTATSEQPPAWNDQQVARFFIETGAPIPHEAASASVHLENVQIDTVPAQTGKGGASRLHASARVHLEGMDAVRIAEQSASCHVLLLAYDLASGETHVLSTTRIECAPDALDVPLTLDADLPEVGRYQLLLAALMLEARALSAVSGPRLRVTP